MSNKGTLRDKISDLRIEPSERVWYNIENNLDRGSDKSRFSRLTISGAVAAATLALLAFLIGLNLEKQARYMPATLEINDQAVDFQQPSDSYTPLNAPLKYRNDGRLVPNYQELWDHTLVPRMKM